MLATISNPEFFRTNIRQTLNKHGLSENISTNIEISIFNYTIDQATIKRTPKIWENQYFVLIYTTKLKSVLDNLNEPIINKLKNGELEPKKMAYYTHQELDPVKWNKIVEDKLKRDKLKFEISVQASTDVFTCGKCKEKKCTYYQAQIRSSDEAITTFVTCLVCDNHWTC
jgi:DNA-directed RNA polymerase subunit M/transcription elongation factor TFIIS